MWTQESLHFFPQFKNILSTEGSQRSRGSVWTRLPWCIWRLQNCPHSIFLDLAMHLSKVVKNWHPLPQVLSRTCKYLLNLHAQEKRDRILFLTDFRSVIIHFYIASSAPVHKYHRDFVYCLFAGNWWGLGTCLCPWFCKALSFFWRSKKG